MTKKVLVETPGDTSFLPGRMIDRLIIDQENERVVEAGGEPATYEEMILASLRPLWPRRASCRPPRSRRPPRSSPMAALEGKVDELRGLKENVIIGKLIPAATGLRPYRNIELTTAVCPPRWTSSAT